MRNIDESQATCICGYTKIDCNDTDKDGKHRCRLMRDTQSIMKKIRAIKDTFEGENMEITLWNYFDLDGNPIERIPEKFPYSYEQYVIWKNGYDKSKSHSMYSDRMFQWNSKKFNESCKKVWGNTEQYFDNRKSEDINKFINLYLEKKVRLTAIEQGCNCSSGFPFWCFHFEE